MTGGGEMLITARRYRTQEANREDARRRLAEMIADAHIVQAQAQGDAAEPGRQGQAVDRKKQRGAVKQGRGKVQFD